MAAQIEYTNNACANFTNTTASIKLRRQKDIYEDFCEAAGTRS